MDSAEKQVVDRLKESKNILVTVRNNPTVDLLSALIGLTLALDKMDKHVAAVFSGQVPSTIEFLKPEETIEQSPDSLRDFIIALDKSKADKLRYKVEDKVVRIFITPYKTSLSQADLEFSQGDFNVDAVVALGAHEQQELDQAITTHGRILHDATVISINNTADGNLGSINWQDTTASSVSELVTLTIKDLDKTVLDQQIATALLTGIVAETERFSNEKTTPKTMSLAGDLMSAGADQQLVATELAESLETSTTDKPDTDTIPEQLNSRSTDAAKADDGTLAIDHQDLKTNQLAGKSDFSEGSQANSASDGSESFNRDMLPLPEPPSDVGVLGAPQQDKVFSDIEIKPDDDDIDAPPAGRSYLIDEVGDDDSNTLASSPAEPSSVNPLDVPEVEPPLPLLNRDSDLDQSASTSTNQTNLSESPFSAAPTTQPTVSDNEDNETLEEIEESVHSPHLIDETEASGVDQARHQVLEALQNGPEPIKPIDSLNAMPLGDELHPTDIEPIKPKEVEIDKEGNLKLQTGVTPESTKALDDDSNPSPTESSQSLDMPLPPIAPAWRPDSESQSPPSSSPPPIAPPPVPPPFMPPNLPNSGH